MIEKEAVICYHEVMNDHAFCFILCVSDPLYAEECMAYIGDLEIPDGYTVDTLTIEGAESMCAGYNAGMHSTDAKYKIYLHQDVFLLHPGFLGECLDIFSDPGIGMIGMAGTDEDRIDPALLVTQIDLSWREDLFHGWDYYALSQAIEMQRAGYRVYLYEQQAEPLFRHDHVLQVRERKEYDREQLLREYRAELYNGKVKKRILYPLTREIQTWDIPHAMNLLGVEPVLEMVDCHTGSDEIKDVNSLSRRIRELNVDAVITHDFAPFAARACAENSIPYISWVWDSPNSGLFDESIQYGDTYIFDFDSIQTEETRERGASFVRHMPLAVNAHRVDKVEILETDIHKYSCEISFVGSLYSQKDFHLAFDRFSTETTEEIRSVLQQTVGNWDGKDHFSGMLSDRAIMEIASASEKYAYVRNLMSERKYIEGVMLSRHAAYEERTEALRRLAKWDVRLYTNEQERNELLPGVSVFGRVSYLGEAPKAYYLSKINLNFTIPSIRAGIPIRVFDIMAAGGFVLTNYQIDLEDVFELGTDLDVFHSFEEMEDKVNWYLQHEEQRLRMALNGCRKVQEHYSYEKMTKRILEIVSEEMRRKGQTGLL